MKSRGALQLLWTQWSKDEKKTEAEESVSEQFAELKSLIEGNWDAPVTCVISSGRHLGTARQVQLCNTLHLAATANRVFDDVTGRVALARLAIQKLEDLGLIYKVRHRHLAVTFVHTPRSRLRCCCVKLQRSHLGIWGPLQKTAAEQCEGCGRYIVSSGTSIEEAKWMKSIKLKGKVSGPKGLYSYGKHTGGKNVGGKNGPNGNCSGCAAAAAAMMD